jgi:ribosomal protein L11 methyltransferase
MPTKEWKMLIVEGYKGFEERTTVLLMEEGSPGVEIEEYDGLVRIKGYFPVDTMTSERLLTLKRALPRIEGFKATITCRTLRERDWGKSWKKFFKPVRIGKHIIVKPAWKKVADKENKNIIIEIDPGRAFGTGTHVTTQMALVALEEFISPPENVELLDVGCGTGILSVAALKLGAQRALAIDTDPTAIKEAEKTIRINGIDNGIDVRCGGIEKLGGTFSIVVANITAEVLTQLAGQLASRLKKDGYLVLSGILEEQASAVHDAFASLGFKKCKAYQKEGWMALVLRR